jgi:uncharacterized protein YgbK (DUF1537 family)
LFELDVRTPMVTIAVIADDLTGAADTGVQCYPYFTDTTLVSYRNLPSNPRTCPAEALAIYTNSRPVKEETARKRVRSLARGLSRFRPGHVYKKVDSCLRGNVGAEVDAVMDEMGFEMSFIAPAFPDMGRVTIHDVHMLHGRPVAETELSRDPVTPVRESRLSRVVASQSRYAVGHVDLQFLEGESDAMVAEVNRLVASGARHLAFDAQRQADLERIARLALESPNNILLVGSAGLARGLMSHFPERHALRRDEGPHFSRGYHLLVCGTVAEPTRLQISALLEAYPYRVISIQISLLLDSSQRDDLLLQANHAQCILSKGNLIIRTGTGERTQVGVGKKPSMGRAKGIVRGLSLFVAEILRKTKPARLFLSGGDTASAVLEAIGARGIRLHGEIVPGMPEGTLLGGPMDGHTVVTKAGAFGSKETLVALHEYWTKKGKEKSA